jgi:hypothetical protein
MRRLKKDSPAVKLKTLLVLRHVVQKGNSFFRRELQRRTEDIRECLCKRLCSFFVSFHSVHLKCGTDFKGPPDPLRGDAPYQLVREQAQVHIFLIHFLS